MPYHRLAHLDSFEMGLKTGIKIKRGDPIGRVGTTGNSTAPHLHYDCFKKRPKTWLEYVWGMNKVEVENKYLNPDIYFSLAEEIPIKWDHYGYGYLSPIKNGAESGFHSGIDLNFGVGWDDYQFSIKSPVNGTIAYMGTNGSTGGWGNVIIIKEENDLGKVYDNHYIQETEESGSFALVYQGKKHFVLPERAGLAALTVLARKMSYSALTKEEWDNIPSGDNF